MKNIIIITLVFILVASCSAKNKRKDKNKNKYVAIETVYGDMIVKLYNETPKHRDNFIKLVNENFYDSLLFHRVIKGFMIQGGDPKSKNCKPNKMLGDGGPGYKIDAEFNTKFIHKKGALVAAREGDRYNPEKKSSGSQFYIVQGTVVNNERLKVIETKINESKKQELFRKYIYLPENILFKQKLDSLNRIRSYRELNSEIDKKLIELQPQIDSLVPFHYTEEQKKIYNTLGGTPHLDQDYTIFGEVVMGINIIDSIANVKVDRNNRPVKDVIMQMKIVKQTSRGFKKQIINNKQ
jgi:cyclophilin family peptidyl-prolyl cis-trans isomerase